MSDSNMPHTVVGRGTSAIVFIHGFLDGSAVWEDVIHHLDPELDATKISVDLAGMGANARAKGPLTLERYAADVTALVAELDRPVVLVGQSMGAPIAELVARALPEKVRGIVFLNPVPLAGVQAPEAAIAPLKSLGGNPEAQRQARKQLSFDLSASQLDRLGVLGAGVTKDGAVAIVDAWNKGHEAGKAKSTFVGPVLLVRGGADGFVDDAMVAATASRFAQLEQVTVENAGHWSHFERPAEVAQLVSRFAQRAGITRGRAEAVRAADWRGAFAAKSEAAFREAFADDVVLDATVFAKPVVGREKLGSVMGAASKVYEMLEFTEQATNGKKQYVEWRAAAFGGVALFGITIITRGEHGKIAHVAIHHRPVNGALEFSHKLGNSLVAQGVLDSSYFFAGTQAASYLASVKKV